MKTTMYDVLLQLPLFQGLGKNDLTCILDKVKIHFSKYKSGDVILKKGETCNRLVFLLNGTIQAESSDKENVFSLYEKIQAPFLIEPYSLFGGSTEYAAAYSAVTVCDLMTIEKRYFLSELNNYEIIRLNYMNILSNRAQMLNERLWAETVENIDGRIVDFVLDHSLVYGGEKVLKIRMDDLARLLGSTRIRVSKALNDMKENGMIALHRGEIRIPDTGTMKQKSVDMDNN